MIIKTLRINQLGKTASKWYIEEYLDSMDKLDIDRYAAFLADEVEVQFNNAPAVEGKAAVVGMLSGYWKSFKAIEHEPLNIYGDDHHFTLEAKNHYVRHDGKKVTTNAVAFTDRNAKGKVTSVRIYADTSPVFEK